MTSSPYMDPKSARNALDYGLRLFPDWTKWVDAGTLLGLYRNGDFIKHDTDVDFAVVATRNSNFDFYVDDLEIIRTWFYLDLPMQIAFAFEGVIIDYYFYYSDLETGFLVNYSDHGVIRIPSNLVLPLDKKMEWEDHSLPIPADVEPYLEWRYGSDWQTPKVSKGDWGLDFPNLEVHNSPQGSLIPGYTTGSNQLIEFLGGRASQYEVSAAEYLKMNLNFENLQASLRHFEQSATALQEKNEVMSAEIASLNWELNEVINELTFAKNKMVKIQESISWRITWPLRKISSILHFR